MCMSSTPHGKYSGCSVFYARLLRKLVFRALEYYSQMCYCRHKGEGKIAAMPNAILNFFLCMLRELAKVLEKEHAANPIYLGGPGRIRRLNDAG